jgi:hypothetical protein
MGPLSTFILYKTAPSVPLSLESVRGVAQVWMKCGGAQGQSPVEVSDQHGSTAQSSH